MSQTKAPLRIGLIGCGEMGQRVHLPNLKQIAGAALCACADMDGAKRAVVQAQAGSIPAFASAAELLASVEVDALLIALPPTPQAEAAIAAFEAGKHVYCEKPPADNWPDAERVLQAWRKAGTVGMVGFNQRHNPLAQRTRQLVASGALDSVVHAQMIFSTSVAALPAWKLRRSTGGGVLLDLASHHIDLLRYVLADEVVEVLAQTRSVQAEADSAAVQLRFRGGTIAQIAASWSSAEEDSVSLYGRGGRLYYDRYLSLDVQVLPPQQRGARWRAFTSALLALRRLPYYFARMRAPWNEVSYQAALKNFLRACQGEEAPLPDMADALRSLRVVLAAEESAEQGRAIALEWDAPR